MNKIIIAFRKDLQDMANGTYVAPLPHPSVVRLFDGDRIGTRVSARVPTTRQTPCNSALSARVLSAAG